MCAGNQTKTQYSFFNDITGHSLAFGRILYSKMIIKVQSTRLRLFRLLSRLSRGSRGSRGTALGGSVISCCMALVT